MGIDSTPGGGELSQTDTDAITERMREIKRERGLTLTELARLAGTSHQQVSKILNGQRRLTVDWVRRISHALGVSPGVLLGAVGGSVHPTARLVGYVGAGSMVYADARFGPWETIELVEAPPGASGLRAVRVLGRALEPRYGDGDTLYFGDPQPVEECLGEECVAQVRGGRAYVRTVMPSEQPGRAALVMHGAEPIEAEIEWVAPVVWVKRFRKM